MEAKQLKEHSIMLTPMPEEHALARQAREAEEARARYNREVDEYLYNQRNTPSYHEPTKYYNPTAQGISENPVLALIMMIIAFLLSVFS